MSVNATANLMARRASLSVADDFSFSCPVKTISSVESAQLFVDEASARERSASRIEDLIIRISGLPVFYDIGTSPIRAALELVPQLTDLTLLLPPTTPPVLLDVHFPALQFFKTNLPHATLGTFLTHHQSLSVLVLGRCGRATPCPLVEVDLSHVVDLECDTECVRSLVHRDLFHLKIDYSPDGPSVGVVFRTSTVCASGLHSLTIDFFADDVDVLNDLSSFAPFLRKLKLVEQRTGSQRRGQSRRRAFNDALTWARTLRKLRFLEELSLQTFVSLVQRVGDYRLERSLVTGWVYGVRSRATRRLPSSAKAHPALYHIRIWYGAGGHDAALSKWYKDGAEWRRLGLPIVGQDLNDIDF